MSTVQDPRKTWLATGSLLTVWWRMPVSVAEIAAAPCLLALGVTLLPLSLQQGWGGGMGEGPVCSWLALLWYWSNPSFCEQASVHVRAFCRKVLFLFSLAIPQFGLLSHISSLRLSSGHSCLVLTLSTDDAAHSLMADARVWATCPPAVVVRSIFWFLFFFFFPSQLC